MESRGIYLRVATFLRAQHAPIEFEYAHSGLTLNLHGEVLEADILFQSKLSYAVAYASQHGHPDADFKKAAEQVNKLHANAFYSIPYYGKLSGVTDGNPQITDDIKAMAERYKKVFKKDQKPRA